MTPGAMAKRNADATMRMKAAAALLAERFGVDAGGLNVSSVGGPEVKTLREREAVAELLEALVERTEPVAVEPARRKAG